MKAILIIGLFLFLKRDYQCSCIPITVEENIKYSDIVFVGEVLKVDTIKSFPENFIGLNWSTPDSGDYYTSHLVTFKLIKSYNSKNLKDSFLLMTGEGGGDCGYSFDLKKKYLVYARQETYYIIDTICRTNKKKFLSHEAKYPTTTICDRTTSSIQSEEKLLLPVLEKLK